MLHRAAVWALNSPRRLTGVSLTCSVLLIALLLAVASNQDSGASSTEPLAGESPASTTSRPSPAGETEEREVGNGRETVERFLKAYLADASKGGSRREQSDQLRHLSTGDLWQGLRLTDPGQFPDGPVKSLRHTLGGTYLNQYEARLAGGAQLVVQVVESGQGWLVSNVVASES